MRKIVEANFEGVCGVIQPQFGRIFSPFNNRVLNRDLTQYIEDHEAVETVGFTEGIRTDSAKVKHATYSTSFKKKRTNGEKYANLLKRFNENFREKRPDLVKKKSSFTMTK